MAVRCMPAELTTWLSGVVPQVMVIEPTKRSSLDLLKLAQSLLSNQLPFTIGLVLSVSPDPAATGRQDAGVALSEAFNYALREETTPKAGFKALQLLIEVRREPLSVSVPRNTWHRVTGCSHPEVHCDLCVTSV